MSRNGNRVLALVFCVMMAATALAACTGNNPPPVNKPPVARILAPVTGSIYDTGTDISFDGSSSKDPEKKFLTFKWDFGDNTTSTVPNITRHSYLLPGKYQVTLQVSDGKKLGLDRVNLTILQANRAPLASYRLSGNNVSNEETVEFNASGSTDADNDTLTFGWSFGDGTNAMGRTATHLYQLVGLYNGSLNVSDGKSYSVAVFSINVFQANRAPVPNISANPSVAYYRKNIDFNASGSTDADNDILTASWDFGDGETGTGLTVRHSYQKIGLFTATANVSDGKLWRRANVTVTVIPHFIILVDWNGTDYGYVVKPEVDSEKANLMVTVSAAPGTTDTNTNITEISKKEFRVRTTVVPARGQTLSVIVKYLGIETDRRVLHIYDGQALPGVNCTIQMDASVNERKLSNGSEEWTNITGSVSVAIANSVGNYTLRVNGGTTEGVENSETEKTVSKGTIDSGWMNMTLDWGTQKDKSLEMSMSGNSTGYDIATGDKTGTMAMAVMIKSFDHNLSQMAQTLNGTMGQMNVTATLVTVGAESHANGAGIMFSCLKMKTNFTADIEMDIPMIGKMKLKMFNETVMWQVRDDRYVNSTVYLEWTQNTYSYNFTSGNWSYLPELSTQGNYYCDDDENGIYNPDPAPVKSDDAFLFGGPVPRELVVGDRLTGTNKHGVKVAVEVKETLVRNIGGVNYTCVRVVSVFSSAQGNASGTAESIVVSDGKFTGALIEQKEDRTWKCEGVTTVSITNLKTTSIRDD